MATGSDRIVIRSALVTDAAAVAHYISVLQSENLGTIRRRPPPTETEASSFIAKASGSDRALMLVALDGIEVVGMLDIAAGNNPHDRHAASFGVSIAKAWRGHGLARRLIETAIGEAKSWPGLCRIEIECVPHHQGAIRLYESVGFVIEGCKRKSMNLGNGPEDMLVMAMVW
jgi:L-phenylalanine/L-methionine N-acetyltransferase